MWKAQDTGPLGGWEPLSVIRASVLPSLEGSLTQVRSWPPRCVALLKPAGAWGPLPRVFGGFSELGALEVPLVNWNLEETGSVFPLKLCLGCWQPVSIPLTCKKSKLAMRGGGRFLGGTPPQA